MKKSINVSKDDWDKTIVPDTSALIDDLDLVPTLIEDGNRVVIAWKVHRELNDAKRNPAIGKRAQQVLKIINEYRKHQHPLLIFVDCDWKAIPDYKPAGVLDPNVADDVIIGTALTVFKKHNRKDRKKVILITHDIGMQIKAREIKDSGDYCLDVQEWNQDFGDPTDQLKMPNIFVPKSFLKERSYNAGTVTAEEFEKEFGVKVLENSGMIISTGLNEKEKHISHVSRVKNGFVQPLDKEVRLMEVIKQRKISTNGHGELLDNWEQIFAIHQLLDLDINYYSLVGLAGSGKSFLALASALHYLLKSNRKFKNLYITRAPVSFGNTLGYVPGSIDEKMGHWLQGMFDNMAEIQDICTEAGKKDVLKQINMFIEGYADSDDAMIEKKTGWTAGKGPKKGKKNGKEAEDVVEIDQKASQSEKRKRVRVLSYEHIRGRTLHDSVIIVEEVQNMPRDEVITFATRLGENSRMIFTGDPSQIDSNFLTEQRNGHVWFASLMKGDPYFSHTYFPETVRSKAVQAFLNRLAGKK